MSLTEGREGSGGKCQLFPFHSSFKDTFQNNDAKRTSKGVQPTPHSPILQPKRVTSRMVKFLEQTHSHGQLPGAPKGNIHMGKHKEGDRGREGPRVRRTKAETQSTGWGNPPITQGKDQ